MVRPGLRNGVLLLASLIYYAWGEATFVRLVLYSIVSNYLFGLAIQWLRSPLARRAVLALAVVLNMGLLLWFKYANFAVGSTNDLLVLLHSKHAPLVLTPVVLPLGISFFTFHALSYVIDIYRRHALAQKSLPLLCLYILFFPQLIAGPIVRYHEIADQLSERKVGVAELASGIERFVVGLAKKMLIANTAAEVADAVFAVPAADLTTPLAWLGVCAYALQVYFDFSGYSDMAIGLARLFGFEFPENFNYPYVARSMTEFWRRWHLSLSRWFRDYLYVPLGGNRRGPWRTYLNLATVFLLCGLWHGASWNFVIWGSAARCVPDRRAPRAPALARAHLVAAPSRVHLAADPDHVGVLQSPEPERRQLVPACDGRPQPGLDAHVPSHRLPRPRAAVGVLGRHPGRDADAQMARTLLAAAQRGPRSALRLG